jgi:kynurenine formamidase
MKLIDLTIPLGIGTPPWPTYEPLQVKYFKRLAPNGANGQLLTHSNHLGTHLDGEIHFFTAGKDIAQLELNDFLVGPGVVVDLSDATGDYQIYTPEMIEERVEVREGDILIIHTGYHQLMHIEMFPHHIIHAECIGGDIDLLCNRRATIGFFPWRFVDGESSIGRCVAMVDDAEYEELMARKEELPHSRFGDCYDREHVDSINRLTRRF